MVVTVLCKGFPGRADLSFLGWSTVALVKSEDKTILFDTGAHAARPMLLKALEDQKLAPKDIDIVCLSHLHFDHCANATLFPNATFVLSEAEFQYANSANDVFIADGIVEYLRKKSLLLITNEDTSLTKDIAILLTPGHTPGGISILVRQGLEKIVLAGDAVKNRAELQSETVNMTLDSTASQQSIRKIKQLASRVLPGHDTWLWLENNQVQIKEQISATITLPDGMQGTQGKQFVLTI